MYSPEFIKVFKHIDYHDIIDCEIKKLSNEIGKEWYELFQKEFKRVFDQFLKNSNLSNDETDLVLRKIKCEGKYKYLRVYEISFTFIYIVEKVTKMFECTLEFFLDGNKNKIVDIMNYYITDFPEGDKVKERNTDID